MEYNNVDMHPSVIVEVGAVIGVPGAIRGCRVWSGRVKIEKGVVIGANVVIAQGQKGETYIGEGSHIMNLALVGHNVRIGKNCEIGGRVAIAGHAIIEDDVKIKTGAVIRNRVRIAKGVTIGIGAVVTKDILEENSVWYGCPARRA